LKAESSAFYALDEEALATAVKHINQTRENYLKQGFDEVYLSVIPNKVTIMRPGDGVYNHLLEKLYNHPGLKVPVIDVYAAFARQPEGLYLRSDSHWNCSGIAIWLNNLYPVLN
jgi:hypothetical protein